MLMNLERSLESVSGDQVAVSASEGALVLCPQCRETIPKQAARKMAREIMRDEDLESARAVSARLAEPGQRLGQLFPVDG